MTAPLTPCQQAAWDKFEEMRADRDSYVLQVMTLRREIRQMRERLMAMVAEKEQQG